MSAKGLFIPSYVPETLSAEEKVFVGKKGKWGGIVLDPKDRVTGRIVWVPVEDPDTKKVRKFPFQWQESRFAWFVVRRGPRPTEGIQADVVRIPLVGDLYEG